MHWLPLPEIPPVFALLSAPRIDPAAIIAWVLTTLGIQALVWGIARDSADIEWWRSALLAVLVAGLSAFALAVANAGEGVSPGPIAGAVLGTAFAVWLIGGALYEVETWQRVVISLASPVIGMVAAASGIALRIAIIGQG